MFTGIHSQIKLADYAPQRDTFAQDIVDGLRKERKELPSKYFYDEVGSHLFDQICELDDYYLTRTELAIMQQGIVEMAECIGADCMLIEYGSGSCTKVRHLLDHLHSPIAYVPIDISKEQLLQCAKRLSAAYPAIEILPVCADYTSEFPLPRSHRPVSHKVAYFPGSTIGNFDREPARMFLRQIARTCGIGGGLLIGVDLKKDFNVLHRAYNDREGVTAAFNMHLLERINQELTANFQLDHFGHYAFYNPGANRIEMHLVSLKHQQVRLEDETFSFSLGESIWSESSYKYTLEEFSTLAKMAGFTVKRVWLDPASLFSVQYLTVDRLL
ncbi:MAG TPA: L-histidine N(alpha)-methyltransferase [Dictyobacter sp.]|nr:L-histidine N(alpha)-methyltransferase [Dictyobacter sp.]